MANIIYFEYIKITRAGSNAQWFSAFHHVPKRARAPQAEQGVKDTNGINGKNGANGSKGIQTMKRQKLVTIFRTDAGKGRL